MILKDIFAKPVDRTIEGVIKADDSASLRIEIEEYVFTREIETRLEVFVDAYLNYSGANGVWISGFFGSGKSHLLKMLSMLVENQKIDGTTPALDLFMPKIGDNTKLCADLKRVVEIPSKSVLFNIDQKADVISKTQNDALLTVFVKVFDEMCGYYGKQGHIAKFERELDSRNLYVKFKETYHKISGKEWHKGREQALLESKNIAKAYSQITGETELSALGILDRYRATYNVSIEDFALLVKAYIDTQAPKFRLNFFVDEVGQYIANNVKLMTNLQTIAESLATKCRGQAWVVVTAQEELINVVGEMNSSQSHDFSKIQARFLTRPKLTSQNVAEVIEKRLLMKTEEGDNLLQDVYQKEVNNFKTLFWFADGAKTYSNFRDKTHFINSYPFIPYQFDLFQSSIKNLSEHNAFEGKHSSVGERSMLGVFQQVAIEIGKHKIGQLATFDLMFDGIRTTLLSNIQHAIWQAEKNLDNKFAVRLLKSLFLVKYVKEFKSTIRNLCVLTLDSFNQDLRKLSKDIEESLNLLEQQSYIQRNGDLYEFLTDEEKDVEKEIKNTDVESSEIAAELEKIIFDQIIKQKKIRYDENGQDYQYSRKLDDRIFGREQELSINVITPDHEHVSDDDFHCSDTLHKNELRIVMPLDVRLVTDIRMYKQTEKYIRQSNASSQREAIKKVLDIKQSYNSVRLQEVSRLIKTLLCKAKLFVSGNKLEVNGNGNIEDPQPRILSGFYKLIQSSYPNLKMLQNYNFKEDQIKGILRESAGTFEGSGATALSEAEQEILATIKLYNSEGRRITLKSLLEKFEKIPYGWPYASVLCLLAKLFVRDKVDIKIDSNPLDKGNLEKALLNTQTQGNIVLETQAEFTPVQIRSLKDFCTTFFDSPPRSNEPKELAKEFNVALQTLINDLKPLGAQVSQYSFLKTLPPVLKKLEGLSNKPYDWYLKDFPVQKEAFLELKSSTIDPMRKFMNGSQKDIYDSAKKMINDLGHNFDYINNDDVAQVLKVMEDPDCFKGSNMQQLKPLVSSLTEKVKAQIKEERVIVLDKVNSLKTKIGKTPQFTNLTAEQKNKIDQPFNDFALAIKSQDQIAKIRDTYAKFESDIYPQLITQMVKPKQAEPVLPKAIDGVPPKPLPIGVEPVKQEAKAEVINCRSVQVLFDKPWLDNEADVDLYLKELRKSLLKEISNGKKVIL